MGIEQSEQSSINIQDSLIDSGRWVLCLTWPCWSRVLLVSFTLRKDNDCFIQWLPVAGESGCIYVRHGGWGSAGPAISHCSFFHYREMWRGDKVTEGETSGHVRLIWTLHEAWNQFFSFPRGEMWRMKTLCINSRDSLHTVLHCCGGNLFFRSFMLRGFFEEYHKKALFHHRERTIKLPYSSYFTFIVFQGCVKSNICDQMGHISWWECRWMYGWPTAPHSLIVNEEGC